MKFGIAGNPEKPELASVLEALVTRFRDERIPFVLHDRLASSMRSRLGWLRTARIRTAPEKKLATSCDILISLGGDGTILRMTKIVGRHGTPILGINLGKLGFLAAVSVEDMGACLDEILRGEYDVEERIVLEARIHGRTTRSYALNDVVVDLSSSSRMVHVETLVNGEYLSTFMGDGVIVSTPTGSTGYALSNGGPIVTPRNRVIMISPICPHTLTARPVIVPDDSEVTLSIRRAPARVAVTTDGSLFGAHRPPVSVVIRKAPFAARLIQRRGVSYFDVLRRKLHWGRDVRTPEENNR